MATLFNVDNQSFLDFIKDHTRKLSKINSYKFYAMTCYFKQDATEKLAESIHAILGNSLCEFHLLIDIDQYCKELLEIDLFISKLQIITGLPTKNISITPISLHSTRRNFHAKAYAVINCDHKIEPQPQYQGFGIVTSANLTNRGIKENIEIGHIFDDNNSLSDFYNIFMNLKDNYSISEEELEERLQKQRESQKAVNLLSLGNFYHKWQQEHLIDLRFPLKLSKKAKERRKNKANEIDIKLNNLGYKSEKEENPSKKPIDIEEFFKLFPKPIPDNQNILAKCSIDTLLGKWIPNKVSDLIEAELKLSTDVYIKILQEHLQKNMSNYEKELKSNIKELEIDSIIDSNDGDHTKAISKWKERIVRISQDENLLKLLLWKYEKMPISLNLIQDPNLILTLYNRLTEFYNDTQTRKEVGDILSDKNNHERIKSADFERIYIEFKEKFIINRLGDVYKLITSTLSLYLLYFITKFKFSELYYLIKFYLFLSSRKKYFCAIVKPNNQIITGIFIRLEKALTQEKYLNLEQISGELIYKTEASKEEKILLLENLVTFKIIEKEDKKILHKFGFM
jgi:hypothetical protein